MSERVGNIALPHEPRVATPGPSEVTSFLSAEEQQWLARARAGEHKALRHLYESYRGQVRAHLYRLLGPDADVDDLTQIVFARAFNGLARFHANSTLGTWLYRITANTTHNLVRQRFRRDRVKTALSWFNAGRGETVGTGRIEARDEAHRILQRLCPDLREVFVLYNYEGLTLQEISKVLNKPVSTIGDRLTRARKRLHELVTA